MIDITRTFQVAVDPQSAVDFLKDFSNAEHWDPGTQSCRRIGNGPIGVGARWHNKSKLIFIPTELEYVLVELTDTKVVLRGENDSAVSVDNITVQPSPSGSTITYRAQVTFKGLAKIGELPMKLIFQKLARDTVSQMARTLQAL